MDAETDHEGLENTESLLKAPKFPLVLHPVVLNLFKYLRLKNLVAARGVCKRWYGLATPLVQDRIHELTIDFTIPSPYGTPPCSQKRNLIKSYLEMQGSSDLEFTSFLLGGVDDLNTDKDHITLFNSFPASLKKLSFEYYSGEEAAKVLTSEVFREILIKTTNLEILELQFLSTQLMAERVFRPTESIELNLKSITIYAYALQHSSDFTSRAFLEDIFKASVKLKELSVLAAFHGEDEFNAEEHILELFAIHGQPTSLKKLDVELLNTWTTSLLKEYFSTAPLEVFQVRQVFSANGLDEFLATHQDTLTDLDLGFCDYENEETVPTPLRIPAMKNLKILQLGLDVQTFGAMDYGEMFPRLQVLKISEVGTSYYRVPEHSQNIYEGLFPVTSSICPSVKELELPPDLTSALMLQNIARIFPNVLKLNLATQEGSVFEVLWECWPNVERLAVSLIPYNREDDDQYPRNLDSIFTGFTEEMVEELKKQLESGTKLNLDELASSRNMSSIVGLRNLKHLIIHGGPKLYASGDGLNPEVLLTDVALLTTFVLMKDVHCFLIDSSTHKFTKAGMNIFAKELELKEIQTRIDSNFVKYDWQEVQHFPKLYSHWLTI